MCAHKAAQGGTGNRKQIFLNETYFSCIYSHTLYIKNKTRKNSHYICMCNLLIWGIPQLGYR